MLRQCFLIGHVYINSLKIIKMVTYNNDTILILSVVHFDALLIN